MIQPGGLFPMLAGALILIFNGRVSREIENGQNKASRFHLGMRYGEQERRVARVVVITAGALLLLLGTGYFVGYMS